MCKQEYLRIRVLKQKSRYLIDLNWEPFKVRVLDQKHASACEFKMQSRAKQINRTWVEVGGGTRAAVCLSVTPAVCNC